MPRPRNPENKDLPKRWRLNHGAYYYQVPPGQEHKWDGFQMFPLGKKLSEAYRLWASRLEQLDKAKTISELLDRYGLEVVPEKAITTQFDNYNYIKKLKLAFGHMLLTELLPKDVYRYIDKSSGKVLARREIALLSHAFTKAVEWGYIDRHPFKGEVRLSTPRPRNRYVEDWEINECLSLKSLRRKDGTKAVQAYICIKQLTGMSQTDLLNLIPEEQFTDEGIVMQRGKVVDRTGKTTVYLWTEELRDAVDMAFKARPVLVSRHLFCNKRGKGYVIEATGKPSGWRSIWRRFMDRVLKETEVKERFTDHDIRAKAGSDASSLEQARALLSHADSKITERVYRRKPEKVMPVSRPQ